MQGRGGWGQVSMCVLEHSENFWKRHRSHIMISNFLKDHWISHLCVMQLFLKKAQELSKSLLDSIHLHRKLMSTRTFGKRARLKYVLYQSIRLEKTS